MTPVDQARDFFPAFRVFIFGQEVTADVLSTSTTHNDARAPSTASVVLANSGQTSRGDVIDEDRYIVTNADVAALNADVDLTKIQLPDRSETVPDLVNRLATEAQANREAEIAIAAARRAAGEAEARVAAISNPLDRAVAFQTLQPVEDAAEATRHRSAVAVSDAQWQDDHAPEIAANSIQAQVLDRIRHNVLDDVKQAVLAAKAPEWVDIPEVTKQEGSTVLENTVQQIQAFRGRAPRYPFRVGDCIFHSNDPIRIFMRDPRDPDIWYHGFAGYVSDWVDDVSENNERTVTIRAEDVMRSLRYARFTTNPGIIDPKTAITSMDFAIQTFASDNFNSMNFIQFIYAMVFGFTKTGTPIVVRGQQNLDGLTGTFTRELVGVHGKSDLITVQKDAGGLYDLDKALIFVLGGDLQIYTKQVIELAAKLVPISDLAVYQAAVDHQVRASDLDTMALSPKAAFDRSTFTRADQDPLTGEPSADAIIRAIGEHPERYPIEQGLTALIPSVMALGEDSSPFIFGFKGPELETSLINRLAKLFDICERVEFSFYATPKGQLIAEMPLNDFDPYHFGSTAVSSSTLQRTQTLSEESGPLLKRLLDSRGAYGPFEPFYKVARRDTIRWSRAFSDEQVRTLVVAQWNPLGRPIEGVGQSTQTTGQEPARRILTSLVPQFGVRMEAAPPNVRINDKIAAELYAQILLNRFNSNAQTAEVVALPQLRIMPNRPILFTVRNFIATCREVSHTINWAGDVSMTLKANYVRSWDGLTSTVDGVERPNYAYLGGFRANTLNYALLSRKSRPAASSAEQFPPNLGVTDLPVEMIPVGEFEA